MSAAGDGPQARSWFEWALDRRFLLQRTEVPVPEAPDSLTIVSVGPQTGAYTLADGVWTLTRESPDFTPLEFRQRFTDTFSADGNTISGAWDKGVHGGVYTRRRGAAQGERD